jgi:riboflavin kinase / FMN adenylyltransferase
METVHINAHNLSTVQKQADPCVIALGYFDGVHLGHQRVIKEAKKEADYRGLPLAVMSFRPHPINVLSEGKRLVPHLTTLPEKEKKLESLGVDLFYLVEFTKEFAALTPEQFVQNYLVDLGVVHAAAGFDFTYGKKGAAPLTQIPADAKGGITVTKVECLEWQGEKISSTAIRQRLLSADICDIPGFLGEHYSVKVQRSGSGFQQVEKTLLPAPGSYAVELECDYECIRTEVYINEAEQIYLEERPAAFNEETITVRLLNRAEVSMIS